MGMQRNDPIVFQSSSITLLQERFKQLQRVKEMREEKQLHRMLVDHEPNNKLLFNPTLHYYNYEPSKHFFHFLPPKSPPSSPSSTTTTTTSSQVSSLSLWSNSSSQSRSSKPGHDFQYQCMGIDHLQAPPLMSFRPAETSSSSNRFDDHSNYDNVDDVDTSLHL
ncbi:hypothetical protein LWI28_028728 [Acer negundo]|uniref:Uncharacterized protein n=1 Tax=Acer negundo TaxID=4023 RepID=A0AAD5IH21_ACENE|nr:hypothetical protein LWI28_028728 [Acer negundo]KAK4840100.1 hypothetical protein QYF36_027487 [Acer negundo]